MSVPWDRGASTSLTQPSGRRNGRQTDALNALWKCYPGVRDRIVTEQGRVRQHVNIFVGEQNIRDTGGLATRLQDKSEIFIIPAVSGGWR